MVDEEHPQLTDPLEASRHPFETYLLTLAAVSGIPLLFGQVNSGSIEAALPPVMVAFWGSMLVLGSSLALVGLYWRGRPATGLLMERSGLVGVGGSSLIYAVVLIPNGFQGLFSACVTAGFGLACFTQARRIGRRIDTAIHQADRDRRRRHRG